MEKNADSSQGSSFTCKGGLKVVNNRRTNNESISCWSFDWSIQQNEMCSTKSSICQAIVAPILVHTGCRSQRPQLTSIVCNTSIVHWRIKSLVAIPWISTSKSPIRRISVSIISTHRDGKEWVCGESVHGRATLSVPQERGLLVGRHVDQCGESGLA